MYMYVCRHVCVCVDRVEAGGADSARAAWLPLRTKGAWRTAMRREREREVTKWPCLHIPSSSWRGERES